MKQVIYNKTLINQKNIFSAYPRPQMKRDSFYSLNGEWDFCINRQNTLCDSYDKKIIVPYPPESSLSGVCLTPSKGEYLHYKKCFTLPENFIKSRVFIHFGAVDQICTVYLNGKEIGTNVGGYHPFSFDITDDLQDTNEIELCVIDDLSKSLPYGKQKKKRGGMWYTPTSGIWQSVWFESVPDHYISELKIDQTLTHATIHIKSNTKIKKIILKESGETFEFESDSITIIPKDLHFWTPEDPFLYEFELLADEDKVEGYFALREISVQTINNIPRICLNNKPYFIQALLDQGYYPDGLYIPKSIEGYAKDIRTAKEMGYNTLRKHIKIEPLIFYHLCDKLGMIVFQDMVNNGRYSFIKDTVLPTIGLINRNDKRIHRDPKARDVFKKGMLDTLKHLYNCPCVLLYTIFNEGWGQFCSDEMYELAKKHDMSRLYDSTSGWFWQKNSDLDSLHVYFKDLKERKISNRPFVISEFGGYSIRINQHVQTNKYYGYKKFESKEELEDSILDLYLNQALPLVKKGLCGLVYTQISDVEDETNGLLTFDREILKVNEKKIRESLNKFQEEYESL